MKIAKTGALAGFLLAAGCAHAQMQVHLQEEHSGPSGDVVVDVTYVNAGSSPASIRDGLLPSANSNGRLWSDLFLVKDADGVAAPYRGIFAYRSRASLERWVTLEPGQKIVKRINLSLNYEMRPGESYRISAPILAYRLQQDALNSRVDSVDRMLTAEPASIVVVAPVPGLSKSK